MQIADILSLQKVKGVGNKSLISIIEYCHLHKIESLEELSTKDFSQVPGFRRIAVELAGFFANDSYLKTHTDCEIELKHWQSLGISIVLYGSATYPKQLIALSDPPAMLVCLGNLELLKSPLAVAVVGTRENTRLGEIITRRTVETFVAKGFCIVSGLALGIDSIAHRATLESKGATIAVVVDVLKIAPSSNRDLAERIIHEGGLLVAENLPNINAVPGLFAKRDRIQSGISLAVFAIETSVDGGTMHAVKAANSLNRPVYVPDPVMAKYPDLKAQVISGTQSLVKDGRASFYSRDSYAVIEKMLLDSVCSNEAK